MRGKITLTTMGIKGLLLICFLAICVGSSSSNGEVTLNRDCFPEGFMFGAAGSAYQYEGAAHEDGRRSSIWDTFTKLPGKIKDNSNGNVAVDTYHLYVGDVALLKDLGFDAYRFSISWSRLLPGGHLSTGVNQEGIDYYNALINDLVSKGARNHLLYKLLTSEFEVTAGIKPLVTIYHWDFPQALEDEYGGFLSTEVIDDFRDFADLCFREFGDRVKHWITLNEPQSFASGGYAIGIAAPGRCSEWYSSGCTGGDSSTEPYIVGHHEILAHAAAVKVYRDKYQMSQNGQIGITLDCLWMLPLTESMEDRKAASRMVAFEYDWFMEPLNSGSYPIDMVTYVGKRLPRFTREESLMVKGSYDFVGLNYYTAYYASDVPCVTGNLSYTTDCCVNITAVRNGIPIGPRAASDWLYVYPKGILDLLLYTKYKYNNPAIYITENGYSEANTGNISLEDDLRINYYKSHLSYLRKAITMGVDVKGFFAWSLLDNFEWKEGYTIRFGIVFVDYKNGLQRYTKKSAMWFKEFLRPGKLVTEPNSHRDFRNPESTL